MNTLSNGERLMDNNNTSQFAELEEKVCKLRDIIKEAKAEFKAKHDAAHQLYLVAYYPWTNADNAFCKDFKAKNQDLYDKHQRSSEEISRLTEASELRRKNFEKKLDQILGNGRDLYLSEYESCGKRLSQYLKELMSATVFNWTSWLRQCSDNEKKDYYDLLRKARNRDPQLKKLFKAKDQAFSKFERTRKRLEKEYAQSISKAEIQLGLKRTLKIYLESND
jgi:hypothetical protein